MGKGEDTVGEVDFELEEAALPDRFVFAGNGAVPFLEVEGAGGRFHGAGDEAEGVVFAPLLAEGMCQWLLMGESEGVHTAPPAVSPA